MPWSTPSLKEVRSLVRDNVRASLPGADASVPNSVLRVLSDAQGGLCHLTLQYIDLAGAAAALPDTAETEWLDRHGDIWLVNSDGTKGRKQATFATGFVTFTGINGVVIPVGTQLFGTNVAYETTAEVTIGTSADAPARALDPGIGGNEEIGQTLSVTLPGVDGVVTVVSMDGGVDTENDYDLRMRILNRIQNPPMGGAQADYVTWALAVPGVTRAWAAPEQGIGTITIRFLMDELRADDDGWPQPQDIEAVALYIDKMRPVTVKDCYVVAPIKQLFDIEIDNLMPNTPETQGAIEASVKEMVHRLAAPGQTIYAAWISYAIMNAPGVQSFNLITTDDVVMPSLGHMRSARHHPIRSASRGTYMSDRHVRRSGDNYGDAFLTLLPQGQAWPKRPGSTLDLACRGLAEYWGFVDSRAADLLEQESDPRTTIELLPDWERNWGLPDPCYEAPQTIGERQLALVMRMTMIGAQSREFFIEIAEMIGYDITISEYRVFVVGMDRCGDSRVYADGTNPMYHEAFVRGYLIVENPNGERIGASPGSITLNPASAHNVTLSGGGLIATNTATTATDQGVQGGAPADADPAKESGSYYFEVKFTTLTSSSNYGCGIATTGSVRRNLRGPMVSAVLSFMRTATSTRTACQPETASALARLVTPSGWQSIRIFARSGSGQAHRGHGMMPSQTAIRPLASTVSMFRLGQWCRPSYSAARAAWPTMFRRQTLVQPRSSAQSR